jgi:hypothetical protein
MGMQLALFMLYAQIGEADSRHCNAHRLHRRQKLFSLMPSSRFPHLFHFPFPPIYRRQGISWFGGDIYRGNPKLFNSSFDAGDYYDSNFNDFGGALVTLFEILIVNNWQVRAGVLRE